MSATARQTIRILVVEDEPLVSALVSEAFTQAGFKVRAVATAAEALGEFVDGRAPDILFTDIDLPGEMDGTALAACARALRPEMGVVLVSGRFDDIGPIRSIPDSVFVAKPFDPVSVCALLDRLAATPGTAERVAM